MTNALNQTKTATSLKVAVKKQSS